MYIQGQYLGNINDYCEPQQDNDYNYYYFVRANIKTYDYSNLRVNEVLSHFEKSLGKGLYIKGNRLFFTLNGAKNYIYGLSCFATEWQHINELIQELEKVEGISNIAYLYGELD